MHPNCVLMKTSTDNSRAGRQNDAQTIEAPGAYILLGKPMVANLVLQATLPGAKRPPCLASAFLGKCASIAAVNLIQQKEIGSWKTFFVNLIYWKKMEYWKFSRIRAICEIM